MTNTMKDEELDLEALEVPIEEAEYILTLDKPFYPKVLYYKTLNDAVRVYEYCKKKTQTEPGEHDPVEMKMTISHILRKRESTDPWF